jgi:hypothetical protein
VTVEQTPIVPPATIRYNCSSSYQCAQSFSRFAPYVTKDSCITACHRLDSMLVCVQLSSHCNVFPADRLLRLLLRHLCRSHALDPALVFH